MIRRVGTLLIAALIVTACGDQVSKVWFKGRFEAAQKLARQRNTLIMIDFYTTWCSWCKRMDKESYAREEIQTELRQLVAMKVNAERGGAELAERFEVSSYPTVVFADSAGVEVDRFHYLPPAEMLERLRRIRSGETFASCIRRLDTNPADLRSLRWTVEGLLDRSDPEQALSRIAAYHEAGGDDPCPVLRLKAHSVMHSRLYDRAGWLFRDGWSEPFGAGAGELAPALQDLLDGNLTRLDTAEQARLLRQARFEDAGRILGWLADDQTSYLSRLSAGDLLTIGKLAFRNGHYELAADLIRHWYRSDGVEHPADQLDLAAWYLYLCRLQLDIAVDMARAAYSQEATPSVCDTLGRLLYTTGEVDEALELQAQAAGMADDEAADEYRAVLKRMEAGEPLDDRPGFESYPGER
jgi:thioredoxin-related protein